MLEAEGQTLQDISIRLTALLGGGLLGIYLIGFFTKRGDARAIWCGIAATVTYTLWSMGKLPVPIAAFFDPYYVAIFGNLTMFLVGFGAGLVFERKEPLPPELSLRGR
jgi:SSS family solute:Na+ symporter